MAARQFHYRAFGLTVASDAAIPGLSPVRCAAGDPDVRLSVRGTATTAPTPVPAAIRYVSDERDHSGVPVVTVRNTPAGAHHLSYGAGAEFLVAANGARVDMHWRSPLTDADAVIYLLGPVLGFVARLRGVVPLHASAVAVDGRAVVFAGEGGAGKSTIAAACASRGFGVLSDDLVAVQERGEALLAQPGHARLGVWPDVVAALFGPAAELPRLSPGWDKRFLDLRGPGYRFDDVPLPIAVIHVLEDRLPPGCPPEERLLTPREALLALATRSYGNYLLDAAMRAREFRVLARLVGRVPVRRLALASSVAQLAASCEQLLRRTPAAAGDAR